MRNAEFLEGVLQNFRCGTFRKLHLEFFLIPQNSNKVKSST